jgi:hypothetical protein
VAYKELTIELSRLLPTKNRNLVSKGQMQFFMKKIFAVLSCILALASCDNDNAPSKSCSTPVTVRNFSGLDGCGYVFELGDGTIIEPYLVLYCGTPPLPKEITQDALYRFNWVDGKKVFIDFNVIDSLASTCMAGKIAKITCLRDAEPNKPCIEYVIDQIKNEEVRTPPAKVYEYTYLGNKVYFIPQFCCDFPSVLLDENCNLICNPDGGFTGGGDGNCSNFFKERKNEKIIWEDDRVNISH